ncbi:MAG: hypothetical protein MUE51_07585 [Thermoleophilia bacterium]|jgi:hypothetical protein|nr:hypothetical protein [Thermoleophilia bacterium]
MRIAPIIAAALALAGAGPAAGMVLVYDTQEAVADLVAGGVTFARGALRQDPGPGGMLGGAGGADRVAKVSAADIEGLTPPEIARVLRAAIDDPEHGARSHLVAVDEIGRPFGDGARAHPRRGQGPVPVDPGSPGARLSAAMRLLEVPSPWGGTYARRVHFYLAPAVSTAIARGVGPHHNLGRDGKPHFGTFRGVMPGLAAGGGVWVEMYHGVGGRPAPLSAAEWRTVPHDVLEVFAGHGGSARRVHLLFAGTSAAPPGAPAGCRPMACQFRLARSTPAGRRLLANGAGAYRVGDQARDFAREVTGGL